eukprot:CAMPEP_0181508952 /NCGR_PEP_ID=MMETSP1110-20121109/60062_1 /TAXON_ID=174948 /ORGANISM="Symbiodinium sp., Strain CCMP421" /LENGTH=69 /DNA_ID=CAMNT_0023638431 /DNA_START=108 /DNA_END=315 /DNA_ORIENTATION=+
MAQVREGFFLGGGGAGSALAASSAAGEGSLAMGPSESPALVALAQSPGLRLARSRPEASAAPELPLAQA